jgi:hypothetical protein
MAATPALLERDPANEFLTPDPIYLMPYSPHEIGTRERHLPDLLPGNTWLFHLSFFIWRPLRVQPSCVFMHLEYQRPIP